MAIQSTVSPVLDMALPVPCLPAKDTHTKSLKKKTISPEPRNGNTQDGALTPSQRPTGPCTRAPADPSSGPVAPQSFGPSGQAAFKNVDHFSLERSRLRPTPLGSVSSATSEGVQPQSLSVSLSLAPSVQKKPYTKSIHHHYNPLFLSQNVPDFDGLKCNPMPYYSAF